MREVTITSSSSMPEASSVEECRRRPLALPERHSPSNKDRIGCKERRRGMVQLIRFSCWRRNTMSRPSLTICSGACVCSNVFLLSLNSLSLTMLFRSFLWHEWRFELYGYIQRREWRFYGLYSSCRYAQILFRETGSLFQITGARFQRNLIDMNGRAGYTLVNSRPATAQAQASEYYLFDWEYGQTPEESSWIASSLVRIKLI